jgi:hypothetical protein
MQVLLLPFRDESGTVSRAHLAVPRAVIAGLRADEKEWHFRIDIPSRNLRNWNLGLWRVRPAGREYGPGDHEDVDRETKHGNPP